MKTKLFTTGLISLCLTACTNKQIVREPQIIKIQPPVITACERLSIKDCHPQTNGELYECALQISKNLSLCADQTDSLINWQINNQANEK